MAQLPFFYFPDYQEGQQELELNEDTSRHVVQVLRMKPGDELNLTDGRGQLLLTSIIDAHKKHCQVGVKSVNKVPAAEGRKVIGISLLKNASRFEWFLEKATEIGIHEIVPLICDRTEKERFRIDRFRQIAVSAMLQSQQCWLPVLHEPIAFDLLFRMEEVSRIQEKYIAHCADTAKIPLRDLPVTGQTSKIVLIGPEGDFTNGEIDQATAHFFRAVSLGDTRLRTETAAIVAAAWL